MGEKGKKQGYWIFFYPYLHDAFPSDFQRMRFLHYLCNNGYLYRGFVIIMAIIEHNNNNNSFIIVNINNQNNSLKYNNNLSD